MKSFFLLQINELRKVAGKDRVLKNILFFFCFFLNCHCPGSICDFYIDQSQQLKVLNLQVKGDARLKPNGFCRRLKIAGWKFYFNSSWTSFPAGDAFRQTKKLRSAANFSVGTFLNLSIP